MNEPEIIKALEGKFAELFGDQQGAAVYFAPGRVNLIGEHTDYNGGHVFPCALTMGTYALARPRRDRKLRYYSLNLKDKGLIETELGAGSAYDRAASWTNYPNAGIWAFGQKGHPVTKGMDIVIYGNIPVGSGLSSSASLLVLIGYILRRFNGLSEVTNQDLALLAQYAENGYIGLNCGIMDQFVIAMGQKDQAIFLDTATLQYEYVPIKLEDASLVIINTNHPRGLHDSKYNERRGECEAALADLQKVTDIRALGDLDRAGFAKYSSAIKDPVCLRRARHAVYENQRTIEAVAALKAKDLKKFGQLMNESHISLRDDYEVTGEELDTLVEAAWTVPGVIGARMTGAGFGGCTVNLVEKAALAEFERKVGTVYREKIGRDASFYYAEIGPGPREL